MKEALITILSFLAFAAIAVVPAYLILRKRRKKRKDDMRDVLFLIPDVAFASALLTAEGIMNETGWAKEDYVLNVKDCTEYAAQWAGLMRGILSTLCPPGEKLFIRQFRFPRDPYRNGTYPGFHRVCAVKTVSGEKFIDTYRLPDGKLLRELSPTEYASGRYV